MRFPYCAYEFVPVVGDETVLYRPVIRVELTGPIANAEFWALLDTGADECYITQQMADFLGVVPIENLVGTVHSASGSMNVRYGEVGIELSDDAEKIAWRSTVGIVDETWPEAILGHRGALEFFDSTFLGFKRDVVLSANRQSSRSASFAS